MAVLLFPHPTTARSAEADHLEEVRAKWLFNLGRDGTYEYIDLHATRNSSPSGSRTRATLLRGTCRETNDGKGLFCRGNGGSVRVEVSEFEFSPTMDSASISFRLRGQENRVTWAPLASPPQPYRTEENCPGGSASSNGLHRYSEAQGRIFGLRLKPDSSEWNQSWLQQGATVGDC